MDITFETIKKIKNGKAPGSDNILPEVMKGDTWVTANITITLRQVACEKEEVPMEWKTGYIVNIAKKGNLSRNVRRIQLLSLPGKVYTRLILERITKAVDAKLREEQAGFRQGSSCTDQIATLRIIMEQWNSR